MSFTQQHADENKAMAAMATELVKASGYFDPAPALENQYDFRDYAKPYAARIQKQMAEHFPNISKSRIRSQVSRAMMKRYSEHVNSRNVSK